MGAQDFNDQNLFYKNSTKRNLNPVAKGVERASNFVEVKASSRLLSPQVHVTIKMWPAISFFPAQKFFTA